MNKEERLEALEKRREKLLDLSLRNRLLNFQDRGAKIVKIIQESPDIIYTKLVDEEKILTLKSLITSTNENNDIAQHLKDTSNHQPIGLSPLNEPLFDNISQESLIKQSPSDQLVGNDQHASINKAVQDSLQQALKHVDAGELSDQEEHRADQSDSFDLSLDDEELFEQFNDDFLQTTFDSEQLEGRMRRIYNEYTTLIESTGSNYLYLAIGFLEWYDPSNEPERPRLAPLILIPIDLERKLNYVNLNEELRLLKVKVYEYQIRYSGEDLASNITLALKLKRSPFNFIFSDFRDEEFSNPDKFFSQLTSFLELWHSPSGKPWRVVKNLRIGFFTFNKDVIYNDLDPKKWPNQDLTEKPLVSMILEGRERKPKDIIPDSDVELCHQQGIIQTVLDADSSQMKVLLRVNRGDDLVVQGPPGTGKSQTIANIIGNALYEGKRVLFMAEKLAALVVVRNRLEETGLAPYCLELHSRRAGVSEVHKQIKNRLSTEIVRSEFQTIQTIINDLNHYREKLNQYCKLMASPMPDIYCKIADLFWKTEFYKQKILNLLNLTDDNAHTLQIPLANTNGLPSLDDLSTAKNILDIVKGHWAENIHDRGKVWNGFHATRLTQDDVDRVERIINTAIKILEQWEQDQSSFISIGDIYKRTPKELLPLQQALSIPFPTTFCKNMLISLGNSIYKCENYETYLKDMKFWQSIDEVEIIQLAENSQITDNVLKENDELFHNPKFLNTTGNCLYETQQSIDYLKDCLERLHLRDKAIQDLLKILHLDINPQNWVQQEEIIEQTNYLLNINQEVLDTIETIHIFPNI